MAPAIDGACEGDVAPCVAKLPAPTTLFAVIGAAGFGMFAAILSGEIGGGCGHAPGAPSLLAQVASFPAGVVAAGMLLLAWVVSRARWLWVGTRVPCWVRNRAAVTNWRSRARALADQVADVGAGSVSLAAIIAWLAGSLSLFLSLAGLGAQFAAVQPSGVVGAVVTVMLAPAIMIVRQDIQRRLAVSLPRAIVSKSAGHSAHLP